MLFLLPLFVSTLAYDAISIEKINKNKYSVLDENICYNVQPYIDLIYDVGSYISNNCNSDYIFVNRAYTNLFKYYKMIFVGKCKSYPEFFSFLIQKNKTKNKPIIWNDKSYHMIVAHYNSQTVTTGFHIPYDYYKSQIVVDDNHNPVMSIDKYDDVTYFSIFNKTYNKIELLLGFSLFI